MMHKPIIVVQGGQYGSEAKGVAAAHLCLTRNVDITVRTGAVNAGHTVVYNGQRYAMQQIPVGWINPRTKLVIGAGAYIHPETLWREIDLINAAMPGKDVRERLYIDYRCGIHDESAEQASKDANRHHRIGATGKGCSEAIVAKIRNRNNGYELFANSDAGRDYVTRNKGRFVDTVDMLNDAIDHSAVILIEGTQGTLLDLHLGPYPFTTSRMTSAANWVAECGLSPALDYEVVLVCRTFPIRVAGNSGPMQNEMEWTDLAREMNTKLFDAHMPPIVSTGAILEFEQCVQQAAADAVLNDRYLVPRLSFANKYNTRLSSWTTEERGIFRVAASELHRDALALCRSETVDELRKLFEMTTVTKKLRRIARLSMSDLQSAVAINRPSWICMTFMDYVEPQLAGSTVDSVWMDIENSPNNNPASRANIYLSKLSSQLGVPIRAIGTGPLTDNMFGAQHLKVRVSTR